MSELLLSLLAGAVWHAASLWCLSRLLMAWLGPNRSRARVIGWLLAKLAVLYPLAVLCLTRRYVSPLGFGLGFSLVLLAAIIWFLAQAQRLTASRSHGH